MNYFKKYFSCKWNCISFIYLMIILLITCWYAGWYYGYIPSIPTPKMFIEYVEVPVEVIKEIEISKYIERNKMPTNELIEHLKPSLDPNIAILIGEAVNEYAKIYQLPRKLILSIIYKESSFDLFARSSAGAIGLMQVIPKFHQDKIDKMGIQDNRKLYHIKNNIDLGCNIFKTYFEKSDKDLDKTFHRYLSLNASEETKNKYKNSILNVWARLEFLEYQRTEILFEDN